VVRSWLRYFAFWDGSTDSSQALRGSQSRGKLAFRFPMPGSVISAPAHAAPIYLTDNTYVWQTQIYSIVLDDLLPRCRRASTSTRTGPRRSSPTTQGQPGGDRRPLQPGAWQPRALNSQMEFLVKIHRAYQRLSTTQTRMAPPCSTGDRNGGSAPAKPVPVRAWRRIRSRNTPIARSRGIYDCHDACSVRGWEKCFKRTGWRFFIAYLFPKVGRCRHRVASKKSWRRKTKQRPVDGGDLASIIDHF
jgi:hypothetical protein